MNRAINRREFMGRTAAHAGFIALGGMGLEGAGSRAFSATKDKRANPFAYEVQHLQKTDPKLVGYEPTAEFSATAPDPRRIAIGGDGRLHVAGRNGLSTLTLDGSVVSEIPLTEPARCVAVAEDGTIYMGVRTHIEVFDGKGQRLKEWKSPGRKTWFTGLTVGENDVFAADSGNRVVRHYDRSGRLMGHLGEKNKEHNVPGLIVPSPYLDVDLGKDGLVRVNNPGRHCVETYATSGDLELSWGKPSAAIEGFCGCCNPIALAVLPDGSCVTCEKGLPRVKVHSADGTFQCVVAGPETFPVNARAGSLHDLSDGTLGGLDAAVDGQGRIYILDLVAGTIKVMRRKA